VTDAAGAGEAAGEVDSPGVEPRRELVPEPAASEEAEVAVGWLSGVAGRDAERLGATVAEASVGAVAVGIFDARDFTITGTAGEAQLLGT
jgi:hypothetical protein